jgi:radical SAM superfamily enzyme YgiQ (UPF0313 family)
MRKVILVNPSMSTLGYSFITPRWLYVIAQATPVDLIGDPVIIDESLDRFNADIVNPGDIVGIGISTGNCIAGYRVLREAKQKGATVVMGGIHATIFPDEPLEMGADAVVTGNGDVIWSRVVKDILDNRLERRYIGGRVPGDALLKARWDLLDPAKYMLPTVQTVAGCPENCSFCSVWVTDGRQPRQRLADKIVEEVNQLYDMGYRSLIFADDNFNPATLGRIAREPGAQKKREMERIREDRLKLFDEYHRSVPTDMLALTQMTAEIVTDDEYLAAISDKMRVRGALVGIESFTEEGLEAANKLWNPVGQAMTEAIRKIQDYRIIVLSSVICGLECDTVETLRTMGRFTVESKSLMAQFTVYRPYPGTKDYYEMMSDMKNREKPGYVPKHKTQILYDKFWLQPQRPVDWFKHANLTTADLLKENKKCWDRFYSVREAVKRINVGLSKRWTWRERIAYIFLCLVWNRVYSEHGISADSVQKSKGAVTKTLINIGVGVYNGFQRRRKLGYKVSPLGSSTQRTPDPAPRQAVQEASGDG